MSSFVETSRELRSYSKRVVEMGACMKDGKVVRCAAEPFECTGEEMYEPHAQDAGIQRRCNPNNGKMGRCLKENTCSMRETDCAEDTNISNFDPEYDGCTYQRDRLEEWNVDEPAFTQFGSCRNTETGDYFCIYSPEDCDESESDVYATPKETLDAGVQCDCSEVHTWGCMYDPFGSGPSFCSVSEDGCRATGYLVFSPLYQRDQRAANLAEFGLDCRLCTKVNTVKPTSRPTKPPSPTDPPTGVPTVAPTLKPTVSTTPTMMPTAKVVPVTEEIGAVKSSTNDKENDENNTALIGGIAGGGVLLLIIFGLVYVKLFRTSIEYDTSTKAKKPSKKISIQDGEESVVSNL